jgi:hypothetical protein
MIKIKVGNYHFLAVWWDCGCFLQSTGNLLRGNIAESLGETRQYCRVTGQDVALLGQTLSAINTIELTLTLCGRQRRATLLRIYYVK